MNSQPNKNKSTKESKRQGSSSELYQESRKNFAEALVHPLTIDGLLANFVTNPDVTGAFAEIWIRSLVASMFPQFRVSTGAIIRPFDKLRDLKKIPQCDVIVWDPSEYPAIFTQGEFALVDWHSARAIIEVKRSFTSLAKFQLQLQKQQRRLIEEWNSHVLGVVISHRSPLTKKGLTKGWLHNEDLQGKPIMTRLLSAGSKNADVEGINVLIDFLTQVARYNYPEIGR